MCIHISKRVQMYLPSTLLDLSIENKYNIFKKLMGF